jgi:NADH-quinone oxidoreductase subunit G
MSPFDPMAMLDEIQRLVPGYGISRIELMSGNDQHTEISQMGAGAIQSPALIVPANNTLFRSGTVGRYSRTLNSVMENKNPQAVEEVPAD